MEKYRCANRAGPHDPDTRIGLISEYFHMSKFSRPVNHAGGLSTLCKCAELLDAGGYPGILITATCVCLLSGVLDKMVRDGNTCKLHKHAEGGALCAWNLTLLLVESVRLRSCVIL